MLLFVVTFKDPSHLKAGNKNKHHQYIMTDNVATSPKIVGGVALKK
jgi:hypothetical protein